MSLTALPPPTTASAAPPPKKGRKKTRGSAAPYGFLSPTVLLMLVLMLVPIVMVIWFSLQDNAIMAKKSEFVGLDNFVDILTDRNFLVAVRNTVVFTVASVVAHLVLGLTFAMLLNSTLIGRVARTVFRIVYFLPWLFTVAVIAVLWRLMLSPNGVVNYILEQLHLINAPVEWLSSPSTAMLSLIFINIWAGYPFYMVSLLAGLQGIPKDLYEAATVDGAGPVQQFFNVTIPQLMPIIISMAMLDVIWTSQQFALIWMTTGGGPLNATEVVATYTYKLAFSKYDFALASASAVIIFLASMVLAFFYARHQKARD